MPPGYLMFQLLIGNIRFKRLDTKMDDISSFSFSCALYVQCDASEIPDVDVNE